MRLFDRAWALRINNGFEALEWTDIDLSFQFVKTNDTTPNEIDLSIFNLNPDHRDFIYPRNLALEFDAGYVGDVGMVFKGNTELINHEETDSGFITKIHAKDGGVAARSLTISETIKEGADIKTVVDRILKKVQNVPPGVDKHLANLHKLAQAKVDLVGFKPKTTVKKKKRTKKQKELKPIEQQQREYLQKKQANREKAEDKKIKRAEILRGEAVTALRAFCNDLGLVVSITNQAINIYPAGAAASPEIIILDPTSGLIGSPEKMEDGGYKIISLLRHEFNPGHVVEVSSNYTSGQFLIQRIEGSGDTRQNDWYAELFCIKFNG